ncbi:hypothetical protein TAMA11512_05900 [Selenomonas sp. TAMA-11512]|uniref:GGDEF domain-containing protein n=1 Tax=Selenomonas sp. TAMA-11512 TaxID=3095337 RepID=UPI00308751FD|nr:hypothetical protein TAMA11512_05900 [Selenomonas sp. TAMA-11512]
MKKHVKKYALSLRGAVLTSFLLLLTDSIALAASLDGTDILLEDGTMIGHQLILLIITSVLLLGTTIYFFVRCQKLQEENLRLVDKYFELETTIAREKELTELSVMYQQESETDACTGLLNKSAFQRLVQQSLHRPRDAGRFHAMFIMDLDHFRDINHTKGSVYADRLLRQYAITLRDVFRKTDILGRFGGDEFVVFMSNVTTLTPVVHHARALLQAARELAAAEDGTPLLSVSIGIAFAPEDGQNYDALYAAADNSLYKAKKEGRNDCYVKQGGRILRLDDILPPK